MRNGQPTDALFTWGTSNEMLARVNGDGSVFIDWNLVRLAASSPDGDPSSMGMAKLLLGAASAGSLWPETAPAPSSGP